MIVDQDINPERDVYYLGAKVIKIIEDEPEVFDFFDVYQKTKQSEGVSIALYSLTLDWLFILGVVESIEKGNIKKCF